MLGGFVMSSSNADPRGGEGSSCQSLVRARQLLEEALKLIDEHAEAPELGARLQEVIEGLQIRTG